MKLVPFPGLSVDPRNRLFLERHGSTVESVSFTDVYDITNALAGRLKQPAMALAETDIGSVESYRRYRLMVAKAARELPPTEPWYHPRTTREVRLALENARINRLRVRLFFGDPATGLDRMELADTVGYIGHQGAELQHPVLLAKPGDRHGVRIHDAAVVRITAVDHHCALYQHRHYHLPVLNYVPLLSGQTRVVVDGQMDVDFDDDAAVKQFDRFVRAQSHVSPIHSLAA